MAHVEGLSEEQQKTLDVLEAKARGVAAALDTALNGRLPAGVERRYGFALLMFEFGDPPAPSTWISNSNREDMIRAVEEWLEKARAA